MRRNIPFVLVALNVSYYAAASSTVPDLGIGGDENDSHTHLRFEGIPKDAKINKSPHRLGAILTGWLGGMKTLPHPDSRH